LTGAARRVESRSSFRVRPKRWSKAPAEGGLVQSREESLANLIDLGAARGIGRRSLLKGGLVLGAAQVASPFVLRARAADSVKIGLDNPLTGTYAAPGKNELTGCQLAIEEINAKGGVLGRPVELIVEDSTSGDAGTAVQKARKLIDGDKVNFLLGNVNSALALAMAQVSNEKKVLHIVPGGHTDAVTGASCHWNVFRVCNTTQMEANAVAAALIKDYGKKFYYITPDYAFGHTLESGMIKACAALGGTRVGGDLTPLGTADFSSYLIKAQAAKPDVIIFLTQGDDMINALKQAVQFGLDKSFHLAGAQQELEALEGLPPDARIGVWVMEWYWKQPGVPHVAEFVEKVRKKTGRAPTARTWFGYVSGWTCAHAAAGAKSLDAVAMAKALQGFQLPPEIALSPNPAIYRAGQNQLIATLYVGNAQAKGSTPDDLFNVTKVVNGADVAGTLEESGCKMTWPA
jgi:branched-chain amino acid transport system substrate-binding protein